MRTFDLDESHLVKPSLPSNRFAAADTRAGFLRHIITRLMSLFAPAQLFL